VREGRGCGPRNSLCERGGGGWPRNSLCERAVQGGLQNSLCERAGGCGPRNSCAGGQGCVGPGTPCGCGTKPSAPPHAPLAGGRGCRRGALGPSAHAAAPAAPGAPRLSAGTAASPAPAAADQRHSGAPRSRGRAARHAGTRRRCGAGCGGARAPCCAARPGGPSPHPHLVTPAGARGAGGGRGGHGGWRLREQHARRAGGRPNLGFRRRPQGLQQLRPLYGLIPPAPPAGLPPSEPSTPTHQAGRVPDGARRQPPRFSLPRIYQNRRCRLTPPLLWAKVLWFQKAVFRRPGPGPTPGIPLFSLGPARALRGCRAAALGRGAPASSTPRTQLPHPLSRSSHPVPLSRSHPRCRSTPGRARVSRALS
jgi:hypothetical protein